MTDKVQILIADDDDDMLQLMSTRCKSLGLDVITASDAMDALANADFYAPAIALIDVRMPGGNGISVCEMMATDQRLSSTHLIVMTGDSNEVIEQRCRDMGVTLIKKDQQIWTNLKPIVMSILTDDTPEQNAALPELSEPPPEPDSFGSSPSESSPASDDCAVQSLLDDWGWLNNDADQGATDPAASESAESPWVLAIDDDPDFTVGLQKRLLSHGVRLVRAYRGMDGYRCAFRGLPAAILLDYHMPDGNGEYVLRRLRESEATSSVPVIVITGMGNASLKRRMLSGGASAFLSKPATWEQIAGALRQYSDLSLKTPIIPHVHAQAGPPAPAINHTDAAQSGVAQSQASSWY